MFSKRILGTILGAVGAAAILAGSAQAQDKLIVGVSWSNFQEERWKTDEAAIKAALEAAGAEYISADAQSATAKQLADVESLIAQRRQGADRPRAGHRRHRPGGHQGGRTRASR